MTRQKYYDLKSALEAPEQVQHLVLYQRGLTDWPEELLLFSNLQILDLSGNRLSGIPGSVKNLSQLQEIRLDKNMFSSFPKATDFAQPIRKLSLAQNQITSIPERVGEWSELLELDIADNPITSGWEHLGQVHQLQSLHLTNTGLTKIPAAWKSLRHLKQLRLDHNQISRLTKVCSSWQELKSLDLSNNQLRIIGPSLSNCYNLERLDLSNNRIKYFDPELPSLGQLNWLNLGHNKLAELPHGWSSLRVLRELHLQANKLKTLPVDFTQMPRLRILDLESNKLELIPENIGDLRQLYDLLLANNPLHTVPESLAGCPLRRLNLRRTAVREIQPLFWQLEELEDLKGPKGANQFIRFKNGCRKHQVPLKFRAQLYTFYQHSEQPSIAWNLELFRAGLRLPLPRLRQQLWQWYGMHRSPTPLAKGSRVVLPARSGFKKNKLDQAGLKVVDPSEGPSHQLAIDQLPEELPESVTLISRKQLREFLSSQQESFFENPLLDRLLDYPTDTNVLLLANLIREKRLNPVQLERATCCWLKLKAGKARSEMASTLQPHFPNKLPKKTFSEWEPSTIKKNVEKMVVGTTLEAESILNFLQNDTSFASE